MEEFKHYYQKLAEDIVDYVNSKDPYTYMSYSETMMEYIGLRALDLSQAGVLEGVLHAAYLLGQQSVR